MNNGDQIFMTEHMEKQKLLMFEKLWEIVKILHIFVPYTYGSEYFAHRDAAESLSRSLPDNFREEFMDLVNKRIKGMSNYSGD